MNRFSDALKAGVKGYKDSFKPAEFSVAGRPVRCPHCGESKFKRGNGPYASTLVCAECGRIEWFAQKPTETST